MAWDPDIAKSPPLLTNVHINTANCVWVVREDTDHLMVEIINWIGPKLAPIMTG